MKETDIEKEATGVERQETPDEACACKPGGPEEVSSPPAGEGHGTDEKPEAAGPSPEELQAKIRELEEQVSSLQQRLSAALEERDMWQAKAAAIYEQYVRLKSDTEAFRRRTERDIEDRVARGKAELLTALLEVLDNFDRFLEASRSNSGQGDVLGALVNGAVMIQKQLLDILSREGVQPIESPVGKPMDPAFHEAVAVQEGGGEHGTIVAELRRGYTYRGTVLRPTRVMVIK